MGGSPLRLSAPTGKTFGPALIAIGIILWFDPFAMDVEPDIVYWLTTAGGILLVFGSVFRGI